MTGRQGYPLAAMHTCIQIHACTHMHVHTHIHSECKTNTLDLQHKSLCGDLM